VAKTKNEDKSHSLFVGIPSNKPVFAVQGDYRVASAMINELRCFGMIRAAPKDMDRPRHRETLKHELQAFAGWSVVGKHALSASSRGEVVVGSRLPARKSGGQKSEVSQLSNPDGLRYQAHRSSEKLRLEDRDGRNQPGHGLAKFSADPR